MTSLPFRGTVLCDIGQSTSSRPPKDGCGTPAFGSYRLYPADESHFCCRDCAVGVVMIGGGIYDGPLPEPNEGEKLLMAIAATGGAS